MILLIVAIVVALIIFSLLRSIFVPAIILFGGIFFYHQMKGDLFKQDSVKSDSYQSAQNEASPSHEQKADNAGDGTSYRPDFNCSKMNPNDSIAVMLCRNSEAAKHELMFDQPYYALRNMVGKGGWKSLKTQAIADDGVLKQCINTSKASSYGPPPADPSCYIAQMDQLTEKYKERLSGSALEEANRPIDQHIALQQKLIDLGYLPAGTSADGVYGEGTRQAIMAWQRKNNRPTADGFVSDDDAGAIMASVDGDGENIANLGNDKSNDDEIHNQKTTAECESEGPSSKEQSPERTALVVSFFNKNIQKSIIEEVASRGLDPATLNGGRKIIERIQFILSSYASYPIEYSDNWYAANAMRFASDAAYEVMQISADPQNANNHKFFADLMGQKAIACLNGNGNKQKISQQEHVTKLYNKLHNDSRFYSIESNLYTSTKEYFLSEMILTNGSIYYNTSSTIRYNAVSDRDVMASRAQAILSCRRVVQDSPQEPCALYPDLIESQALYDAHRDTAPPPLQK